MTEQERELDLMVAELEVENKMMRARNEHPEQELERANAERLQLKAALERIMSVSRVALWDGKHKESGRVVVQAPHDDKAIY